VVGGDLGRRLGLVRVGLEALVADLDSVDAVEEEVRPLRDLAAELASLAAPVVPDGTGLERLRERALAVLRAFAAPGATPAPGRPAEPTQPPDPGRRGDPGFWRR
jgi:hypothetical protein